MSKCVLVVAAHPDDEVLGCGGTLARHAKKGDMVHTILVADGVGSRLTSGTPSDVAEREKRCDARRVAARRAAAILAILEPKFLDFADQRLDTVALLDLTRSIEQDIAAIRPDIVYTHHYGDLNEDHRVVAQAVLTACRPLPGMRPYRLLAFETPSSTEWSAGQGFPAFEPTWFVDIADQLETKMRALEAYASEMRPFPHPRSYDAVKALTQWRGATVGLRAAEAFRLIREIETP